MYVRRCQLLSMASHNHASYSQRPTLAAVDRNDVTEQVVLNWTAI